MKTAEEIILRCLELGEFNLDQMLYLSKRQNLIWIHTGLLLLSYLMSDLKFISLIPSILSLIVIWRIIVLDRQEQKRIKQFLKEKHETNN